MKRLIVSFKGYAANPHIEKMKTALAECFDLQPENVESFSHGTHIVIPGDAASRICQCIGDLPLRVLNHLESSGDLKKDKQAGLSFTYNANVWGMSDKDLHSPETGMEPVPGNVLELTCNARTIG